MIDQVFWYTGLLTWLLLGLIGWGYLAEWLIDRTVNVFWTKRMFLSFVWDKMKTRKRKGDGA